MSGNARSNEAEIESAANEQRREGGTVETVQADLATFEGSISSTARSRADLLPPCLQTPELRRSKLKHSTGYVDSCVVIEQTSTDAIEKGSRGRQLSRSSPTWLTGTQQYHELVVNAAIPARR